MTHRSVSLLLVAALLVLLTGCSDDGSPLGFTSIEDEINDARPIPFVRVERPTGLSVFERPDDYREAFAEDGQLVLGRPGVTPKRVFNLRAAESVEITATGVVITY
jgi:hypothetical protein